MRFWCSAVRRVMMTSGCSNYSATNDRIFVGGAWRREGYRPTDDMKLGPFARLPREHHQAHQKQIAALPTQSVEAQKREKKRMRRKGKRRGRSKTPPPQPEAPPVDFLLPRVPSGAATRAYSGAACAWPTVGDLHEALSCLCFGGALLGAGRAASANQT